ncbi:MAG: hypothetical protein ABI432_06300 [Flavobacteriales bacterium]
MRRLYCALSLLILGGVGTVRADHFSGASITYTCVGVNTYTIFLDLYLDCSGAPITPQTLYFDNSCGVSFSIGGLTPTSVLEVSPLCPGQVANSTCNGGALPSFKKYQFQTTLYLSPCDFWTMHWHICCRNTMQNIQLTPGLYAEATLYNLNGVCDASPKFVDTGIPYVCVNQPVGYNPGVSDANGNAMSFSLISARFATPVPTDVTYQGSYSGAQPFLGITINAFTGQLAFTPTVTGYYVVVIKVNSYTSGGVLIGSVMRDLMFAVAPCSDPPPVILPLVNSTGGVPIASNSFYVCNGQSFCVDIPVADNTTGVPMSIITNALTVLPGSTFTVFPTSPVHATLCWTGNSAYLPATMFIQATDGACPIENVVSTYLNAQPCSVLPIELLSFTAKAGSSNVLTEWTTGSEQNSGHFTVERSTDRMEFKPVGRVDAAGNSQQARDYRFTDTAPVNGTSYYRLRETDLDGTETLSDVVAVNYAAPSSLIATWNGVDSWSLSGAPIGAEWTLVDMQGRTLGAGTIGDDTAEIIPSDISDGLHLLVVRNSERTQMLKLPSNLPAGAVIGVKREF